MKGRDDKGKGEMYPDELDAQINQFVADVQTPPLGKEELEELLRIAREGEEYDAIHGPSTSTDDQLIADVEAREKEEIEKWLSDLNNELEKDMQQPSDDEVNELLREMDDLSLSNIAAPQGQEQQTPDTNMEPEPENHPTKQRSKKLANMGMGNTDEPVQLGKSTAEKFNIAHGDLVLFQQSKNPEKLADKIADTLIKWLQKLKGSSREDAQIVHAGIIVKEADGRTNVIHFTNKGLEKVDLDTLCGSDNSRYQIAATAKSNDADTANKIADKAQDALTRHEQKPAKYSLPKAVRALFKNHKISNELENDVRKEVEKQQICSSFCMSVVNEAVGKKETKYHSTILPGELKTALVSANFVAKSVVSVAQQATSRKSLQESFAKVQAKLIDPIKQRIKGKSAQAAEPEAPQIQEDHQPKSPRH